MGGARYLQDDYMTQPRLHSYAHQLGAIIKHRPENALEVGVGSGYVQQSLRLFGVPIDTLDILEGNQPDVLGSVDDIPLPDGAYDLVSCCQVLEHLPYEKSKIAMKELARVSRRRVLISLPDASKRIALDVAAPKLGRRMIDLTVNAMSRPFPKSKASIGHQWEIGYQGYPDSRILADMASAGLQVEEHWRVPELPWHHFFDCSVR